MNRSHKLVIALSLAVSGVSCADTHLEVMSFNLRHGLGADGQNSWPLRKETLVNVIKEYAPDIVATQECLAFQADFLAEALPEYHWFGVGREANGKGEMAAVFYKKEIVSPVATATFWLSETPEVPGSRSWETGSTRVVTWAKFHHPGSGQFFCLFNTHLDNASEQARQQGARLLLERTSAVSAELPVILTGDFNAPAEASAPWQTLTDGGFADAWLAADSKTGPEVTFGAFGPPPENERSRIDWILIRGSISVKHCETVLYNESGRYPSDHYPVVAKLALGSGPSPAGKR